MKKHKVELTEEQLCYLRRALGVSTLHSYHQHGERLHKELLALLNEAEPIQDKVWLPFTTLKDGGTYLTRDGREVIVVKHPTVDVELLRYPYRDKGNLSICWTKAGRYYWESADIPNDLILELQPSEEQTAE